MPSQYHAQQDYGQMPPQGMGGPPPQQQYAQGQEQPQPQPQQPYSGQKQFERPQPDWSLLEKPAAKPYASPSGLAAPNPDSEVEPRRSRRATPIDPNPRERAAGADRERISDSREFAEKEGQLGRKERADLGAHLDAILGERDAASQQALQGALARQQRQAARYAELADSGAAVSPNPNPNPNLTRTRTRTRTRTLTLTLP